MRLILAPEFVEAEDLIEKVTFKDNKAVVILKENADKDEFIEYITQNYDDDYYKIKVKNDKIIIKGNYFK